MRALGWTSLSDGGCTFAHTHTHTHLYTCVRDTHIRVYVYTQVFIYIYDLRTYIDVCPHTRGASIQIKCVCVCVCAVAQTCGGVPAQPPDGFLTIPPSPQASSRRLACHGSDMRSQLGLVSGSGCWSMTPGGIWLARGSQGHHVTIIIIVYGLSSSSSSSISSMMRWVPVKPPVGAAGPGSRGGR